MKDYTKFRSASINNSKSRSMDFQSFSSSPPPQHQEKSSPRPISTPKPTPISPTPVSTTPNPTTPMTPSHNNNTKSNTTATTTPNANDLSASTPNNEQVILEDGSIGGEKFGVILTRNCSVSSTPASTQKFRAENQKQNKALQAAVVRAFSMRRSASVSEGYSRIHDQSDPFGSPTNDDDNKSMQGSTRSSSSSKNNKNKNKKGRKILRACKSFFGL